MVEKKTKAVKNPKNPKKGGNVMQDLQNLAVPFGILLAKKGLDSVVSKESKKTKSSPAKPVKKTSKKGGTVGSNNLEKEFSDLSNQIEKFLNKY